MLLRKPRSYAEIYNDVYDDVVTLFRVLRDEEASNRLIRALEMTPFSRSEFDAAMETSIDGVECARRLIVRSHQGFGSDSVLRRPTGFRANSNRSGTTPAHDWANYPAALLDVIERFRGVVVENRDALDVIRAHDTANTLFYLDPPYLHSTRAVGDSHGGVRHRYACEMTDDDHSRLLDVVRSVRGMVVLSGYPNRLYDEALKGWTCDTCETHADGARDRTECLWLSPNCQDDSGLFAAR